MAQYSINDIARIVSEEIEYSQENVELIKSLFNISYNGDDYENNWYIKWN